MDNLNMTFQEFETRSEKSTGTPIYNNVYTAGIQQSLEMLSDDIDVIIKSTKKDGSLYGCVEYMSPEQIIKAQEAQANNKVQNVQNGNNTQEKISREELAMSEVDRLQVETNKKLANFRAKNDAAKKDVVNLDVKKENADIVNQLLIIKDKIKEIRDVYNDYKVIDGRHKFNLDEEKNNVTIYNSDVAMNVDKMNKLVDELTENMSILSEVMNNKNPNDIQHGMLINAVSHIYDEYRIIDNEISNNVEIQKVSTANKNENNVVNRFDHAKHNKYYNEKMLKQAEEEIVKVPKNELAFFENEENYKELLEEKKVKNINVKNGNIENKVINVDAKQIHDEVVQKGDAYNEYAKTRKDQIVTQIKQEKINLINAKRDFLNQYYKNVTIENDGTATYSGENYIYRKEEAECALESFKKNNLEAFSKIGQTFNNPLELNEENLRAEYKKIRDGISVESTKVRTAQGLELPKLKEEQKQLNQELEELNKKSEILKANRSAMVEYEKKFDTLKFDEAKGKYALLTNRDDVLKFCPDTMRENVNKSFDNLQNNTKFINTNIKAVKKSYDQILKLLKNANIEVKGWEEAKTKVIGYNEKLNNKDDLFYTIIKNPTEFLKDIKSMYSKVNESYENVNENDLKKAADVSKKQQGRLGKLLRTETPEERAYKTYINNKMLKENCENVVKCVNVIGINLKEISDSFNLLKNNNEVHYLTMQSNTDNEITSVSEKLEKLNDREKTILTEYNTFIEGSKVRTDYRNMLEKFCIYYDGKNNFDNGVKTIDEQLAKLENEYSDRIQRLENENKDIDAKLARYKDIVSKTEENYGIVSEYEINLQRHSGKVAAMQSKFDKSEQNYKEVMNTMTGNIKEMSNQRKQSYNAALCDYISKIDRTEMSKSVFGNTTEYKNMMKNVDDFLKNPNNDQIRTELKNICNDYIQAKKSEFFSNNAKRKSEKGQKRYNFAQDIVNRIEKIDNLKEIHSVEMKEFKELTNGKKLLSIEKSQNGENGKEREIGKTEKRENSKGQNMVKEFC